MSCSPALDPLGRARRWPSAGRRWGVLGDHLEGRHRALQVGRGTHGSTVRRPPTSPVCRPLRRPRTVAIQRNHSPDPLSHLMVTLTRRLARSLVVAWLTLRRAWLLGALPRDERAPWPGRLHVAPAPAHVRLSTPPGTVIVRRPPPVLRARASRVVPASCTNAPRGWLSSELARQGAVDLDPQTFLAADRWPAAYGYLDRTYAACGEPLGPAPVRGDRARRDRLGGPGGELSGWPWWPCRLDVETDPCRPRPRRSPPRAGPLEIDQWPTRLVIRPTAEWPPGAYVLVVTTLGRYRPVHTCGSVADPRRAGPRSPYLVVGSDLTQLAYNDWGGRSLYAGPGYAGPESSPGPGVRRLDVPADRR